LLKDDGSQGPLHNLPNVYIALNQLLKALKHDLQAFSETAEDPLVLKKVSQVLFTKDISDSLFIDP